MSIRPRPPYAEHVRCLLFTDTINDVNGVARFVQTLSGWACAQGKDLCVLSSSAKSRTMDFPIHPCVEIVPPLARMCLPGYADLDVTLPRYGEFLARAREFKPDVIHVSTPGPVGMCGKLIARKLGVPLAGTWHTNFAAYVQQLSGLSSLGDIATDVLAMFYRDFDLVLARSPVSLADIRATGVKRYRAFAPGVDLQKFNPVWKDRSIWRRWGLEPERKKVVYVGRVSREKGVLLLASVAARLRGQQSEADVVIVGSGPLKAQLEQLIPDATFTGFVHGDELSRVYASSDLVLFPSETDTLGQVVLEAQASGVGVMVTDRGGPRFLVNNGVTGRVIAADREAEWGECVGSLLGSPDRLGVMGQDARRHMQNYDIASSCEAFWNEHRQLLDQLRAIRT